MRTPAPSQELHIASLVVQTMPHRLDGIAAALAARAAAQVHASSPEGKLVVTLEASSAEAMAGEVASIGRIEGVLSAALVYQCSDTVEAMNEVVTDVEA